MTTMREYCGLPRGGDHYSECDAYERGLAVGKAHAATAQAALAAEREKVWVLRETVARWASGVARWTGREVLPQRTRDMLTILAKEMTEASAATAPDDEKGNAR